jgi:hypothetical protein
VHGTVSAVVCVQRVASGSYVLGWTVGKELPKGHAGHAAHSDVASVVRLFEALFMADPITIRLVTVPECEVWSDGSSRGERARRGKLIRALDDRGEWASMGRHCSTKRRRVGCSPTCSAATSASSPWAMSMWRAFCDLVHQTEDHSGCHREDRGLCGVPAPRDML